MCPSRSPHPFSRRYVPPPQWPGTKLPSPRTGHCGRPLSPRQGPGPVPNPSCPAFLQLVLVASQLCTHCDEHVGPWVGRPRAAPRPRAQSSLLVAVPHSVTASAALGWRVTLHLKPWQRASWLVLSECHHVISSWVSSSSLQPRRAGMGSVLPGQAGIGPRPTSRAGSSRKPGLPTTLMTAEQCSKAGRSGHGDSLLSLVGLAGQRLCSHTLHSGLAGSCPLGSASILVSWEPLLSPPPFSGPGTADPGDLPWPMLLASKLRQLVQLLLVSGVVKDLEGPHCPPGPQ